MLILLGLGFLIAFRSDSLAMPWFVWGGIGLLELIASSVGVFWGMRVSLRSWSSLRIVLDEDGVTQVRDRGNIRILYSEITRIDIARGGLAIRTTNPFRLIVVPSMLQGFDNFRFELAQRHAIDEVPPTRVARNIAVYIATLVLMLAVVVVFFAATNRYVIIAASIGVLLLPIYMIVARRKGLVSPLGPFLFWFSVILIALMAIGRLILAVLGRG